MAFISQALLFVIGVAAMVSLVPLAVWAATGRIDSAWWALRRYSLWLAVLAVAVFAGAALTGLTTLFSS